MTLNPTQIKHHMRILRTRFGATSKIGRRASVTMEAIDNLDNPVRAKIAAEFQRGVLERSIKRQLRDIARLAG